jgi:peptidoglycan/LPS O-acetylase OafA/YrhL
LRFFAALLVFCWHATWTQNVSEAHFFGPAGVEFFFVLSGFILSYTYHRVFSQRLTLVAMRLFWVARFARIYPLYAASLAAFVAVGLSGRLPKEIPGQGFWPILLTHVALVQTWAVTQMGAAFCFSSVDWSVSDEAFFYTMFPLLATLVCRRSLDAGRLLLYAAAVAAIGVILNVTIWPHVDERIPYVFPPLRLPDFVVGMLLGIAFIRGSGQPSRRFATALEFFAVVFFFIAIAILPAFPSSTAIGPYFLPASAAIVGIFAYRSGQLSRVLSARALVYLGEISFALYLVHPLALAFLPSGSPLQFSLAFLASIALAVAAHELLERPLRDVIRASLA